MSETQPKPVQPEQKRPEGPPAGMTQEAWQRMQLTWGMIEALTGEPSQRVKDAAQGDMGMEAVLAMTEGLLKAGGKMGIQSDEIVSSIPKILPDKPVLGVNSTPLPPGTNPESTAPQAPVPPAK